MPTKDNDVQGATSHVGARVPTELAEAFARLAESEYRSVSQELRRLMERRVAEADEKKALA